MKKQSDVWIYITPEFSGQKVKTEVLYFVCCSRIVGIYSEWFDILVFFNWKDKRKDYKIIFSGSPEMSFHKLITCLNKTQYWSGLEK